MNDPIKALSDLLALFREIDAGENAHAHEFLAAEAALASQPIFCPECFKPAEQDHNSFQCHGCRRMWPKGHGHEPTFADAAQRVALKYTMHPWQPIETAKTDGSWYLLAVAGDDDPLRVGWQWLEPNFGDAGDPSGWMSDAGNPWEQEDAPTHCIPYPDHPGA